MATIAQFFRLAAARQASDIYFGVGSPPILRVNGALRQLEEFSPFTPEALAELVQEVLTADQVAALQNGRDVLSVLGLEGGGRMRVLGLRGTQGYALACRLLPDSPPSLESLGLPRVLPRIVTGKPGLVLIIGPPASGKTTTLAALVEYLNQHTQKYIMTLEKPAEFIHRENQSLIRQSLVKENGEDEDVLSPDILQGLDVLVLDGLPAKRTVSSGLAAATYGVLVLASLEARGGTAETLGSCLEGIPELQQELWRLMLARHLRAVIWQQLLPGKEAGGRRPAVEVLINDKVIRGLLSRPGMMHLIRPTMAAGRAKGMQTMRQALEAMKGETGVAPAGIAALEQAMASHYLIPVTEPF